MSTRGLFIVRKDNRDSRCIYIDSYADPDHAGREVVEIIKECESLNGCNILSCLLFPTDKDCKYFNGPKIVNALKNGEPFLYTNRYTDFIKDSLFCRYAYVVNIDKKVLEFYVGFQTTPETDNRYGTEATKCGFYPCKRVYTFTLDDIASKETDWIIGKVLESPGQSEPDDSNKKETNNSSLHCEKPNELMITFGGSYLYFKTDKTDTKKAFEDFCDTCDKAGINIDNMQIKNCILRDAKTYEKLSRNYQP